MKLYTDYPITELNDTPHEIAPIRACEIIDYDDDGNKYLYIKVGGIEKEVKRFYVYSKKGRCGEVEPVSDLDIQTALQNLK